MTSEREARAGLTGAVSPGSEHWTRVVRAEGAVAAWERLLRERDGDRADPARPARDLLALERLGGRLLIPGDQEWPVTVDRLVTARYEGPSIPQLREPLALWVRGPLDLAAATLRAAAVVGSRAATAYGAHTAAELGSGLAGRGWTVVSGGAFGIDAAAHRGALAVEGPTVAVLAGGVDVLYPRGNLALLQRVAATGALVSEVPLGFAPMRGRFLLRNRLIAGLSRGVVLVEAGWRSGALNTTAHARAVERPVLAVPGPVTSLLSAGCHREVRERGALLVTNTDDVVAELGAIGEQLPGPRQERPGARDGLRADVLRLLEAVPARAPAGLDSIARIAGLETRTALQALGHLAVAGLVEDVQGSWRLTALGRAPAAAPGAPAGGARAPGAPAGGVTAGGVPAGGVTAGREAATG